MRVARDVFNFVIEVTRSESEALGAGCSPASSFDLKGDRSVVVVIREAT